MLFLSFSWWSTIGPSFLRNVLINLLAKLTAIIGEVQNSNSMASLRCRPGQQYLNAHCRDLPPILDDDEAALTLGGRARGRAEKAFSLKYVGAQLFAFLQARGGLRRQTFS